jgi:glycosyltransferase involved in cell wall biosynthesis
MKVLIAAASFASELSGVQRHALNVVRCLLRRSEISSVNLVAAPWQRKLLQDAGMTNGGRLRTHFPKMERSSLGRNLWYYRRLPALAAEIQADVVHLSFPMPIAASFQCPTVVTLHDLYPYEIPGNFGFPQFIYNRWALRQCLRNIDAITCVSETTMMRLKQYLPRKLWRKAIRIYNCVEPEPLCVIRCPISGWRGEPFLLCVAQHRRNKNLPLLLRAFQRLITRHEIAPNTKLMVIGIAGPQTKRIHQLVSHLGVEGNVLFIQGLSDAELQWCYARCEALIVPSTTEGFGLPVAEALLAGCRVVCSDIPALREVGGEYCRFVSLDANAVESLAIAILASIQDAALAPISLPHLSADALSEQYLNLYRALKPSAIPNTQFVTAEQASR